MIQLIQQDKDTHLLESYLADFQTLFTKIRRSGLTEYEHEKLFTPEKFSIVINSQMNLFKKEFHELLNTTQTQQLDPIAGLFDQTLKKFSKQFEQELFNINELTCTERVLCQPKGSEFDN